MIKTWIVHRVIDTAIALLGNRVINNFKHHEFKLGDKYSLIISSNSTATYELHGCTIIRIYPNRLIVNSARRVRVDCNKEQMLWNVNSMVDLNSSDTSHEFYK